MPRYDYKCVNGHVWEESRKADERHLTAECPTCKGIGTLTFKTAPRVLWFPGTTRSPFRETKIGRFE